MILVAVLSSSAKVRSLSPARWNADVVDDCTTDFGHSRIHATQDRLMGVLLRSMFRWSVSVLVSRSNGEPDFVRLAVFGFGQPPCAASVNPHEAAVLESAPRHALGQG